MAKSIQLSSIHLELFKEIEKSLWRLFWLFENLCFLCYQETVKQINEGGARNNRKYWCCCTIDNQVHDNWESLNAVQRRIGGKNWYEETRKETHYFRSEIINRRMPGNGPCPALCETGCTIKRFRPITCTTQLCEKMLFVLSRLAVENVAWDKPLQIEDIINLPEILKALYGLGSKQKVHLQHAKEYIKAVNKLRAKFSRVDAEKKKQLIEGAILFFMIKGGK
ncbi:hypothetical protein KKF29_00375 [Patescibacteria group bacterium]|nr:hypothetical protein [Patescibacteria group bacterium]